jgi:hypothetical protein
MIRVSGSLLSKGTCFISVFLLVVAWIPVSRDFCRASQLGSQKQRALSAAEKKWGVKIMGLRPTAAGYMLDLRLQVLDPAKATHVLSRKSKAFIVDQGTGKALPVPVTKSGPLRQTTLKPEVGRYYFALFSNPGGLVKEGSKVTVVIGDFRAENITVEGSGIKPPVKKPQRPELSESNKKRWESMQNRLRHEYQVCMEHCGNDAGCLDRCKKAMETQSDREYQRLMHES